MRQTSIQFGLPLLTKELIEQSARKRTYIVRTLYAVILYGIALWYFRSQTRFVTGFSILGQGRQLYSAIAMLEFWGIFLFLPAMTCSVLTAEKERDTLGLLLLTKLGPWTIIFEKLFSRLVPMATFVLLSLPLLAIAYSLGGIETEDIVKLMWVLAVTALQVGSFSVLCSAWFRTTASAFLATYLLGAVVIGGWGLILSYSCRWLLMIAAPMMLTTAASDWLFNKGADNVFLLAFGPALLNGAELIATSPFSVTLPAQTLRDCVVMTIPLISLSMLTLITARLVLWRRAFIQPKSILMKLFRSLDQFFHHANNNRLTRGVVLIKESVALPLYQPISWRETSKRSLGTTRYLIRFLLLVEVPVLIMILWPATEEAIRSGYAPAYVAGWCLWAVATLVLAIQSTGLIGTERSHQTLDVLLTTPIESHEIVRQKFAGIWRMIRVLWVPFTTLYLFQMWWESFVNFSFGYMNHLPLAVSIFTGLRAVLAVGLYLPTIAWFGFYRGLRARSQTQAIMFTITAITVLCAVPPMVAWFLAPPPAPFMPYPHRPLVSMIAWISPAVVLSASSFDASNWLGLIVHFMGVAVVYLWYAYRSRIEFARRVGRNDDYHDEPVESMPTALTVEERFARIRRPRLGASANDFKNPKDMIQETSQ